MSLSTQQSRQRLALCLEPRMMFDAAAVATAVETQQQAEVQNEAAPQQAQAVVDANVEANVEANGISSPMNDMSVDNQFEIEGYASKTHQLALSGTHTIALTADNEGNARLAVYERDSTGQLKEISQTSEQLEGAQTFTLSTDKHQLYVLTEQGVSIFNISAQGELSSDSQITFDNSDLIVRDIVSNNDSLYITTTTELRTYQQSNGNWTLDQQFSLDGGEALISPNQQHLYVATIGETSALSIFAIGNDGRLTEAGDSGATGSDLNITEQIALSADGSTLYALDHANGYTLSRYLVNDDGSLTATGKTITFDDNEVNDLTVREDGNTVYLVGDNINVVLYQNDTLTLSNTITEFPGENVWSSILVSDANKVLLSPDGQHLMISQNAFMGSTIMRLSLSASGDDYTEESDPVILLPEGQLHGTTFNNAQLTIGRSTGPDSDDLFSFKAGNGYSISGQQIMSNGQTVATLNTATNGQLEVTFNAQTTAQNAQEILRQITYQNTSDDPTRNGKHIAVQITFRDPSGATTQIVRGIELTGVNDPPEATITLENPTYYEEGEAVNLYRDAALDTIEQNQLVARVKLTLNASGENEIIRIGEDKFKLDEGVSGFLSSPSGADYTYNIQIDGNQATLTLALNSSPEDVSTIVDSIQYENSNSNLSGERKIELSFADWGRSGSVGAFSEALTSTITLAPPKVANTAPALTSSTTTLSYTENGDAITLPSGLSLQDDQLDALNNGQGNYGGATITLSLTDTHNTSQLNFNDGNDLTLVTDASNQKTITKAGQTIAHWQEDNGQVVIEFIDTEGTIPQSRDVQNLLHQINYLNNSDAPADQVQLSITATDPQGLTSSSVEFAIEITTINDIPALEDNALASIGALSEITRLSDIEQLDAFGTMAMSEDGRHVFVGDTAGTHIAVFSRDDNGLTYLSTQTIEAAQATDGSGIQQLVVSPDNQFLYVLGQTEQVESGRDANNDPIMLSEGQQISTYAIDNNGNLTLEGQYKSDFDLDGNAFWDTSMIQIADDGQHIYAINNYSVIILDRNTRTGELSHQAALEGSMGSEPYLWSPSSLMTQGDYVYVTTDPNAAHSLIIYHQDNDGGLTPVSFLQDGQVDSQNQAVHLSNPNAITVSSDQRKIFIVDDNGLQYFKFDPDSQTLTYAGQVLNQDNIQSLSISENGQALSVIYNNTLVDYSIERNTLSAASALTFNNGQQVLIDANNHVLALSDGQLSAFNRQLLTLNYALEGEPLRLSQGLNISDAELDAANNGAGDYQGTTLTLSGQSADIFGFSETEHYTFSNGQIHFNGQAIAELTNDSGQAVLTFTATTTSAQANDILHQINFTTTTPGDHEVTLIFNDGEANSERRTLTINAGDFLPPELTDDTLTLPQAEGGEAYSFTFPEDLFTDPNNLDLTLTVSGLPEGLSFDAITRTLSGTPTVGGEHEITITANNGTLSTSLTLSLMVDMDNLPPEVNDDFPTTLELTPNEDFSYTFDRNLVTDPESGDLSWQIEDLPEGLSFDPETLTLSGKLSEEASYRIKVIVTDEAGASVERTINLTVGDAVIDNQPPEASDLTLTLPDATAGIEYQFTLPEGLFTDPDGDTLTLSISGLPSGLTFDPETRTLSGTPEAEGSITITITATDTVGASTSREITLEVLQGNQAPSTGDADIMLPNAEIGKAYQYQIPIDALVDPEGDPLTWSLSGLPEGFSFDPATRTITGMPSEEATFNLTLTATDDSNASGSRTLTLVVTLPPADPALPAQPQITLASPPNMDSEIQSVLDTQRPWNQWDQTSQAHTLGQQWHTFDMSSDHTANPLDEIALNRTEITSPAIIELTAIRSDAGQQQFALPRQLLEENHQITVRQANGAPLPSWAHFDAAQQRIDVDAGTQHSVQQLGVEVQMVNAQGQTQSLFIMLNLSQNDIPTQGGQDPDETAQQEEITPSHQPLSVQLAEAGPRNLFSAAQQLIEQLLATAQTHSEDISGISPNQNQGTHQQQASAFVKES
ncbi:hypothetical protein BFW38_00590 [Terasakiispira papahanaumokuakeensis]|uniref:Dystroglycan-type cadherin-like domain-containing protein n=1 Tax=Terasakiispira papahanaumokuakeensis TaxID=197479 RepID=A0A1E2V5I9_9GAMM|nr:putative Ig domain-containing protein [Terasakiispira papahanaumokuakeensis]ODC02259.1 hypothetical protein BFW38_00590 [Terasakiispira papahanaumokuakeensis]